MEIAIVAVGRLKAGPESDLCARYLDRARKGGRALGFRGFAVKEIPESRVARPADRIAAETDSIMTLLLGGRTICLDERGELLDSGAFAADLSRAGSSGISRIVFVVGGPDGLGDKVKDRADRRFSLGRLTWPHQIARILLAEQLYRATTILSGHPYHRA
jgi:23S rRNA (pseudouridine1915-N3)-methyltransferase